MTKLKYLIYPLILLLGFYLGTRCTPEKKGESSPTSVKTTVEYKTDTIYKTVDKERTVFVDKPTVRVIYQDRLIPVLQPDSTPTLAVRDYSDTTEVEKNLKIGYRAEVTGVLNKIQFTLHDTRPEKIVTNTLQVTTEVDRVKNVSGLFIGGFSVPNLSSFGPQVNLVTNKLEVGVGYDVKSNQPEPLNRARLQLGYKIL